VVYLSGTTVGRDHNVKTKVYFASYSLLAADCRALVCINGKKWTDLNTSKTANIKFVSTLKIVAASVTS
jgi:hypothetical protein